MILHTPKQRAALERLAASRFDPDDYKSTGGTRPAHETSCKICNCRYAPGGTCGYCRHFVKVIRALAEQLKGAP